MQSLVRAPWLTALAFLATASAGCVQGGDPLFRTADAGGGGGDTAEGPCSEPVDFATEVAPIFESSCALGGCHAGPNGSSGLVLDPEVAYDNIVAHPALSSDKALVEPGDVEQSFLADRIRAANGASLMPPIGGPLPEAAIATITCWIEQGAPREPQGPCAEPVDYEATIAPIFEASCALSNCHAGPSGASGLVLDPGAAYDHIVGQPANGSDKLLVAPGEPDASFLFDRVTASNGATRMPPIGDPLPSDQIESIKCWIEQGAKAEPE
jgi:hypothetical protein